MCAKETNKKLLEAGESDAGYLKKGMPHFQVASAANRLQEEKRNCNGNRGSRQSLRQWLRRLMSACRIGLPCRICRITHAACCLA
ncbi:hypothetical protein EIKCOROL_01768 [Eikenella corrodens ATCC 23834]|uniref:Uncharacterized protein n=1 Tax=Eikenella corrodens ATCC 23834 TaxID=546274 RepID=C0DWL7_EIKCO|nr:hypothetical protein EIKCOROL_01768 [Eikenella corrodens ATCC 23834]